MMADSDMTYEAAIRHGTLTRTTTVRTFEYARVEFRSISAERAAWSDTVTETQANAEPHTPLPLGLFIDVRA